LFQHTKRFYRVPNLQKIQIDMNQQRNMCFFNFLVGFLGRCLVVVTWLYLLTNFVTESAFGYICNIVRLRYGLIKCIWISSIWFHPRFYFLDSERSDKCIDFTMICVIFRFWAKRWMYWFYNEVCFFVNIVGALGRSKFKFPKCFQKRREKQHTSYGKTGIFT